MKHGRLVFLLMNPVALILPACAGIAQAADNDAAALLKVTQSFYEAYMTLHPSDGIPDAATRGRFTPLISPALEKLLEDGDAAERRYKKITKNQSPPLIEGDLFSSLFEGATAYHVGVCSFAAQEGHCAVALTYDDGKDKPTKWTDTVELVKTQSGWRVDDIVYGGTWDFAEKGRLTLTLKTAISEGNAIPP